jgi:hypothetical protein
MSDTWGTPAPAEQPGQGQPEILSNGGYTPDLGTILAPDLPPARRVGKGKLLVIGGSVVAGAAIGVGAAVAAGALGGGGAQPDSFVPANAAAYASVDLDPSLGQKVDALRFLRKFPSARSSLGSTDDIRQWFFDQATKDDPDLSKLNYDRDVKPWIGDRFAVAALPSAKGGEPNAVVVLQVSDEGKAKAGLAKLMSKPDDGVCSVSSGYAVCAENRTILNAVRAEAAKHSLADNSTYRSDVSSVGKRGIALAWGDLGKLSSMVPGAATSPFGGMAGGVGGVTSGRFVASIRFTGDDVELVGTTRGGSASVKPGPGGTGVEKLPVGTVAAIGGSLDPHAIDQAYAKFRSSASATGGFDLAGTMEEQLGSLGIHLPKDLDALFGTKFQIAFGGFGPDGTPQVGLHSNAPAGPAGRVLDTLSGQLSQYGAPFALRHVAAGDGYAVALDERYAKQLASGGRLGDQAAFKRAVPDAASAQTVGYVDFGNLQKAMRAFGSSDSTDADLKALLAAGFSVTTGSDGTATVHATLITR